MFYAYVVKSTGKEHYYKGHCENIGLRLQQHNAGMTQSLKPYLPVELVYAERFETREEAIQREKYFKSFAGRRYLKAKLGL